MTQEPVSTTTLPGIMNESVDVHQYLRDKEDEAAMEILPALIYFGLLAVIGDVGNAVALVVYYKRFKPSSTRTYILTMSVLDILFSTFSLPGEILDLRFSLTFDQPWLCRVHRFNTVFLTVGSGFILVAVALDRRRKICHPFRQQLSARQVKLTVIGSAALAAAIAVPFSVLNGRHTVDTEMPGVKGAACSVDDLFLDTLFPLIYNLLLGVVFIFCITSMIVSYVQIGRKIVRHKRKSAGLHGTMLATLNLVDRLESGDAFG
nr:hypothetical protein BaRGS_027106 [Batillaria attramentaria]